jgi:subtilisin family serine protease
MMPSVRPLGLSLLLGFACLSVSGPAAAQRLLGPPVTPPAGAQLEVIPGQFIVELQPWADVDRVIGDHGVAALHRYRAAFHGFAARLGPAAAGRLAGDPRVRAITADTAVHAFPKPPGSPGGGGGGGGTSCAPPPPGAFAVFTPEAPTGVRRIGAAGAGQTGAGVKVVAIDTGVDFCHPDLDGVYRGGVNLLDRRKPPRDDHGHGAHVSGIIAAEENGFGVRGVAPGVSLHAVKALDRNGSGSTSTIIKGMDWAVANGMDVINMSLGAFDMTLGTGPMCTAVGNAVAAGLVVVSAAGNSLFEALYFTPANCPGSLTVSAFADTDGLAGGLGPPATEAPEADDTFAESFSNYSMYCWDLDGDGLCTDADDLVVNLMAPGVDILSTMPTYAVTLNDPAVAGKDLHYDILTGSSMAAPHVAGLAALYLQANPGATPAQVRQGLTAAGRCPAGSPASPGLCPSPWPDDYDGVPEPLAGWP